MTSAAQKYFDAIDTTWPAASYKTEKGWLFREGRGGGKRVSAVTRLDEQANSNFAIEQFQAEQLPPLFMVREDDTGLSEELARHGFYVIDPVTLQTRSLQDIPTDHVSKFENTLTPVMEAVWREGGLGQGRFDVMDRVTVPKVYLDLDGKAAAFAAIDNGLAMVHAVEVLADHRAQGLGTQIMNDAMVWASANGATEISVLTVQDNMNALMLYQKLNFVPVSSYHYRTRDF